MGTGRCTFSIFDWKTNDFAIETTDGITLKGFTADPVLPAHLCGGSELGPVPLTHTLTWRLLHFLDTQTVASAFVEQIVPGGEKGKCKFLLLMC